MVARYHYHMRQGNDCSNKERSVGNNCIDLKGGSRVCMAQTINIYCSQITIEGQHHFNLMTESEFKN